MDRRRARFVPTALILLALTGCTADPAPAPDPTAAGTAASDVRVRDMGLRTLALDAPDPAELALTASQLVFEAAPVVVVAVAGDDAALPALSAAAVALHAPALLVPASGATDSLAREADRLGARAAVVVQDAPAEIEAEDAATPAVDPTAGLAERAAQAAGLEVVRLDPDDVGRPGGSAAADDAAPTLGPDDLADLRAELALDGDEPRLLTEVLALTDPEPGQEAALATLEAAGAVPFAVPGGDLGADGDTVRRVDEAQALTVVGVGPRFADADRLAWQVRAAEAGALLPTGSQRALPARYVATTAVRGQDPRRAVERAAAAAASASDATAGDASAGGAAGRRPAAAGPVVPTVVVGAATRQVSPGADGAYLRSVPLAELEPVVDAARAAGQQVLLEVEGGSARLDDQVRDLEPLLRRGGVGVVLHPEQRRSGAGLDRGGSVPVAELQAAVDYLASVVTDDALPQTLLVVHDLDDAVVDAGALDARPQVAVLDADALEVAS